MPLLNGLAKNNDSVEQKILDGTRPRRTMLIVLEAAKDDEMFLEIAMTAVNSNTLVYIFHTVICLPTRLYFIMKRGKLANNPETSRGVISVDQ